MRDLSQTTHNPDRRSPRPPGETVVILLDVDGVVNALGHPAHGKALYRKVTLPVEEREPFEAPRIVQRTYKIRVGGRVLAAIHAWHAHPLVHLRWCTTWGDAARDHLAPVFDLPADIDAVPGAGWDGDWKQQAAREVLAQGHPLVWADDVWAQSRWLPELPLGNTPGLFIAPDPDRGLLGRHLTDIAGFIDRYTGQPITPPPERSTRP